MLGSSNKNVIWESLSVQKSRDQKLQDVEIGEMEFVNSSFRSKFILVAYKSCMGNGVRCAAVFTEITCGISSGISGLLY